MKSYVNPSFQEEINNRFFLTLIFDNKFTQKLGLIVTLILVIMNT